MAFEQNRRFKIRQAMSSDRRAITRLGEHMHQETFYSNLPYSRRKAAEYIAFVIANPDSHCLYVAEAEDQIIGFIGGYLDDYIFCDECVACDTVFYVEKAHRGSLAAKLLINAFRDWAKEHDAREVCLGISSGINTERVGQFYERLGFTCLGAIYKQRLR